MNRFQYILSIIVLMPLIVLSQPKVSSKQTIDSVVVYQDHAVNDLYYYVPFGLKLVKDKDGKPDFKFLQMRYTGTRATGDDELRAFRSLLRFKIANHSASARKLEGILNKLKGRGAKRLKPIPISNLKTSLVHTAASVVGDTLSSKFDTGFLENVDEQSSSRTWKERDFVLRLDNSDAQQFADSFENQRTVLSVNYSYFADMVDTDTGGLSTSGTGSFGEAMDDMIVARDTLAPIISEVMVNSGAISIEIDINKWPDLIKKVDINERVPADYPLVDIYCFDFNNTIRNDLYIKKVEIKAEGVSGRDVIFSKVFRSTEPELYASRMKFINAVKLDKPFLYRITEIYHDGEFKRFDWQQSNTWHEILDITTQIDEQ